MKTLLILFFITFCSLQSKDFLIVEDTNTLVVYFEKQSDSLRDLFIDWVENEVQSKFLGEMVINEVIKNPKYKNLLSKIKPIESGRFGNGEEDMIVVYNPVDISLFNKAILITDSKKILMGEYWDVSFVDITSLANGKYYFIGITLDFKIFIYSFEKKCYECYKINE